MATPTVVVFTANSNTGESTINHLLDAYDGQVSIRGIVRKMENKDEDLEQRGVQYMTGDIMQRQILKPIFKDAHAAYFAVPTARDRVKHGKAFVDACIEHGCQHAVLISMCGVENPQVSYLKQFAEIEAYANSKAGMPVKVEIGDRGHKKFGPIFIRSPPFYQNFYAVLMNVANNTFYYPLEDKDLTHVDVSDVGKAIATVLVDPAAHVGKAYNIIGDTQPGNLIASTVAMKAGIQCTYASVEDNVAAQAFQAVGLQAWIAAGNVEMLGFIRSGGLESLSRGDYEALTGEKPTKFSSFVKNDLKPLLTDA